jgi:hypothetical protein
MGLQAPETLGASAASSPGSSNGGRAENLHASGALGRFAHPVEVDRPVEVGVVARRFAGPTVEVLCAPGVCRQRTPAVGEVTRKAWGTGDDCDSPGADRVVLPVDMHQDLAVQHVEELVLIGMDMEGRRLPLRQMVLEQHESAIGLLGARLPRMHAAAVEPKALTLPSLRMIETAALI